MHCGGVKETVSEIASVRWKGRGNGGSASADWPVDGWEVLTYSQGILCAAEDCLVGVAVLKNAYSIAVAAPMCVA